MEIGPGEGIESVPRALSPVPAAFVNHILPIDNKLG